MPKTTNEKDRELAFLLLGRGGKPMTEISPVEFSACAKSTIISECKNQIKYSSVEFRRGKMSTIHGLHSLLPRIIIMPCAEKGSNPRPSKAVIFSLLTKDLFLA